MPAIRLPRREDALFGARGQYALLADAVAALPDDVFAAPTRLGDWRVAELVAHLSRTAEAVTRYAAQAEPARPATTVHDYLGAMRSVAPAVARRAAEVAEGRTPAELRADFAVTMAEALAALEPLGSPESLAAVVPARLGELTMGDFLMTRCVEGVVHGFDLRAVTGVPADPNPSALHVVVRALASLLVAVAPGRAVEVRVPGHLAMQCVEGPRHTRGTPGSVVEVDPVTFVELASGRQTWAAAKAAGALHASGEHADLTPYLPVIG